MQVLEPIWVRRPLTGDRIRSRIERVLNWAKVRGYRDGQNPATWRGHLDQLLPAARKLVKVKHHPALPYHEIYEFLELLRKQQWLAARCIEFLIHTATRSQEARGAKWQEIDFKGKVWTIPPSRMKGNREHRVPLSDHVIDLLRELPKSPGKDLIFPGGKPSDPLHDRTLSQSLGRLNYGHVTIHGFRSSFRDWSAEQTNHPREVAEAALAHINADKTEAAYRRSDLFEKRRRLMEAWSEYCNREPQSEGTVVLLHGGSNG
jgi:integrase